MASPLPNTNLLDNQLAAVSGVVTPSKIPRGQKPRRPTNTSSDNRPQDTKICVVCGSTTTPEHVKDHFVACMHTNGNPIGVQWWHNFVDAPKQQIDKPHHSDQPSATGPNGRVFGQTRQSLAQVEVYQNHGSKIGGPSASTPLNQAFAIASEAFAPPNNTSVPAARRTEMQRAEGPNKDAARLAAVNGVVVPSRVAPGDRPNQGKLINHVPRDQDIKCNICGRGISTPSHVRSHFAVCVGRNGNPYGVKWDDQFSSSNLANFPTREIHVSKPLMPLTLKLASPSQRAPQPITNSVPQNMQQDSDQSNKIELTFKPYGDSPSAPSTMTGRELAMGVLSNGKLLDMLQAWQAVISSGQEAYASNDNGFRDVMAELEERRLIDGNWRWTVSDDRINKTYVRLLPRSKGIDQLNTVNSNRLLSPWSNPTTTDRSGGMDSQG